MGKLAKAEVARDGEPGGSAIESAVRTLELERAGLTALQSALTGALADPFNAAVEAVRNATGRVIITGIGKSGHVGQKIAATLASTGTPAHFVHASEASHGDLGMITPQDVVIALSWSGETVELSSILNYTRRFSVPLIALTSKDDSALGKAADIVLALPRETEACPLGLAPTTSTVMQLAIGDCLAIALLESQAFSKQDFKVFHPGGQLGASLKYVSDIMHSGDALPLTHLATPMADALVTMTSKSFGCIGAVDEAGNLAGIVTDGDLRRKMADNLLEKSVADIMTANPKTLTLDMMAPVALEMLSGQITAAFVVEDKKPVGIVHLHDLLRAGVA